MILLAKSSVEIYETIGEEARVINTIPRRAHVWGLVQMLALDQIVLNLCKVYDKAVLFNKYEQNSIEHAIQLIKSERLNPLYPKVVCEFINKYNHLNPNVTKSVDAEQLQVLYQDFKNHHDSSFQKIITARDSRVAHSDHNQAIKSVASLDEFDKLIRFGWDFCSMVALAYNNVHNPDYEQTHKTGKLLREVISASMVVDVLKIKSNPIADGTMSG